MKERLIEELKVLRLQPGETLVIQSDRLLSDKDRQYLCEAIEQSGIKAIVLDAGLKVGATVAE